MTAHIPKRTELDRPYSDPNAEAVGWDMADRQLADAEVYWFTTVRPDGRPHMTPVIGIWHDGAIHVTTGPDEVKANNLASNVQCLVMTTHGDISMQSGYDVMLEGNAERVSGPDMLATIARAYKVKYGWDFTFVNDGLSNEGHDALVFRIRPTRAFGHGRDNALYTATRWTF